MIPVLKSGELTIRPFSMADAPRLSGLINNWNIVSMLTRVPYPYEIDHAREWIASHPDIQQEGDIPRAIVWQGELVGATGYHHLKEAGWEIGYWIGQPYWGRGIATKTARLLVKHAFADWKLGRLISGHFADNPASGRVLEKAGFRYVGEEMRYSSAREEEVRCLLLEQTLSDYLLTEDAA
ncbi:GCN5-like N-acetyltransferase [Tepidicaulis marinus]|uniref:GCN5-like N-acetyltransferase n=1 Tax=Tepidicaulis marinus TaxID=1333998 RepID=A0A081B8G1_9HYPH|nr:GNAT family N-acetyltransferase [Tepidicaulis marinus]GAK44329.1 GCN5-like N-acetyltransferase [Tepidicaulis marinus]